MAAIQVYKTDTFETQRLKINQIGQLVSNFSGGGNDFAAGNLKLGDGTISQPSLSFTTDNLLGFYKPAPGTLGIVSDSKKIVDFKSNGSYFIKNLISQRNSLLNTQFRIDSRGSEYDSGVFQNVPLSGGTGTDATANFTVVRFVGSVTSSGKNYNPGNYTLEPVVGGSGTGTTVNFIVDTIEGDITPGSGYTFGAYENVNAVGGSGTGAVLDILVSQEGEVSQVIVKSEGSDYETGDVLSVNTADIGGTGSGFQYTITSNPGVVRDFNFSVKGIGYSSSDVIELRKTISGLSTNLTNSTTIVLSSVAGIYAGDFVNVTSGSGSLRVNTTVVSTDSASNTITISSLPTATGSSVLEVVPPYGDPANDFSYTISNVGEVSNFSISSGGSGFEQGDIITVDPTRLVSPITYMVAVYEVRQLFIGTAVAGNFITAGSEILYGDNQTAVVHKTTVSNGNLESIIVDNIEIADGDQFQRAQDEPGGATLLDVASSDVFFSVFMDTNGDTSYTYAPSLTIAPGYTYDFSLFDASNQDHLFALSEFPGGSWGTSYIQNVTSSVDVSTTTVTVSDTTGIVEGMVVVVESGTGNLITNSKVVSIDGPTTLTIDKLPLATGSCILSFRGVEYTTNVTRSTDNLRLVVTADTPTTLYYYCSLENADSTHHNEGGLQGEEATISNILANERTQFGSGFQATIAEIESQDVITLDPANGNVTSLSVTSPQASLNLISSETIFATNVESEGISVSSISSIGDDIDFTASNYNILSDINIGVNKVQINQTSGNITTAGNVKTTSTLNVNDNITITNSSISGLANSNITLSPFSGKNVKINAQTSLIIPVGTTSQRPQTGSVETGSIRFNTTTQQYEGYNGTASSWSSLGGVRDVDGNTYILAEASVGANDNTLYFYNNGNNTLRITNTYLDFRSTKKIRSENMLAPAYTNWSPNTPVQVGDFLKYKNNVYEVFSIGATGQTAGSANPPVHTTGTEINGDTVLQWYSSAVDTITFEEILSVRIDPNGDSPLEINDELVFKQSVIRTKVEDLTIAPPLGKKVRVFATSSLVIPVGSSLDRGTAEQGSIRYNTTISQFEGYSGTNWSSLGGVRDVDGNTYIIPELSSGSNENILYFYNDSSNTLQLSVSGLDFVSTDNITSSQSDTLNINVSNVTFDNLGFAIDNSGTSTLLTSTKESVDFKLSTGLTTEKLFSLTDEGELVVNSGYTSGSVSDVAILDYNLKDFELADRKDSTDDISLVKGTIDAGSTIVYDTALHISARVSVIVDNVTKNEREMKEFNVCHKGADIFYTEYGNITTSDSRLISTTFDFTVSNQIRLNFTLNNNNDSADVVNIVVLKTAIKK